jgi:hypothetical protein
MPGIGPASVNTNRPRVGSQRADTIAIARPMSALPPKADIGTQSWNVRIVPKADIAVCPADAS